MQVMSFHKIHFFLIKNGEIIMIPLYRRQRLFHSAALALVALTACSFVSTAQAADKKPNVVMLMSDDVGWGDYGAYFGGAALGHPTPNIDRIAKEGAMFTSWYGQASCTAGRASFMTGRIPVRTALSVVVVPGDPNGLDRGHADHRRVLQEERLSDLLLRQVASRRRGEVLPDRARLRRDEAVRRLLPRRLWL